ncbi:hypothetical protein WJX84_005140 [Apatococcus fuscideae]|uniref:tRNA dimethylallyltransferase n=1 Tax=Apatococcus fuscideae TaxID=2026836 RepID=A0AAW1RI55_9CHLO
MKRGLDIGSDKLPLAERQGINHHLLDILPAQADFSAGDFFDLARAAIDDVVRRGKLPIIVGGTGLYLRWLVHGKPRTPRSTPLLAARAQRKLDKAWARVEAMKGGPLDAAEKWKVAVEVVRAAGDPVSADRLAGEPNNFYRLLRVYEILLDTGQPLAQLDLSKEAELDYDFRCFFLNRPRMELYRRIDARCEQMLHNGILQEAKWLLDEGVAQDSNCASRAIGYRQAMQFLEACLADPAHLCKDNLVDLVDSMQQSSRQLCHRQLTWFRDDAMYQWLDATRSTVDLVLHVQQELQKPEHKGDFGKDYW